VSLPLMLLFEGERIFALTVDHTCEDAGMGALRNYALDAPWVSTALWAIAAVAVGSTDHLMRTLATSGLYPLGPRRGVQVGVVASWVMATAVSQVSLMLFARAQVSYVMMFIHVALGLLHIGVIFHRWGWGAHLLATAALATFALGSAISMPCAMSRSLTSLGAVLDTFNFVACILTSREEQTPAFITVRWAFLAHATYIWAFLVMGAIPTIDDNTVALVLLRSYGVLANSAAVFLGTLGVLRATVPTDYADRRMVRYIDWDAESAEGAEGAEGAEWRQVGVGWLRLVHQGGSDEAVPSSRCGVPNDARHWLALHLSGALGGVANWRSGHLFWLGSEVCTRAPVACLGGSWVQPTESFLWAHRVGAWVLFLTLLDLQLASGRSPIPAFVLA